MPIRKKGEKKQDSKLRRKWAGYTDWGFDTFELNKAWTQKIADLYPFQFEFGAEGVCPICGKTDLLYPIQLRACDKCARAIIEQDEVPVIAEQYFFPDAEICHICGRKFYVGWIIHTRVCHRCTERIAKTVREKVKPYHIRIARRIA